MTQHSFWLRLAIQSHFICQSNWLISVFWILITMLASLEKKKCLMVSLSDCPLFLFSYKVVRFSEIWWRRLLTQKGTLKGKNWILLPKIPHLKVKVDICLCLRLFLVWLKSLPNKKNKHTTSHHVACCGYHKAVALISKEAHPVKDGGGVEKSSRVCPTTDQHKISCWAIIRPNISFTAPCNTVYITIHCQTYSRNKFYFLFLSSVKLQYWTCHVNDPLPRTCLLKCWSENFRVLLKLDSCVYLNNIHNIHNFSLCLRQ